MAILTISAVIYGLLVFTALWAIYKVFVRPQIRMNFYRKQGIPTIYNPLIGRIKLYFDGMKKHRDDQYYSKVASSRHPTRAICSNLGSEATIVLHDTALIKEFYLNNDNYVKAQCVVEPFKIILGRGVLTSEGSQWKRQRKFLSSVFHFEFLKSNLQSIHATIHQFLYDLRNEDMNQINIMDEFKSITGEVVGKMFFGENLSQYRSEGKRLTKNLEDIMIEINKVGTTLERFALGIDFIKRGILPKHKELMNRVKAFRAVCLTIINARRDDIANAQSKKQGSKDMLDLLLEYTGEDGKIGDEEIIDQFVTFFLAGMDTTGHMLTTLTYYLHEYPEHRAKVLEEVRENYSDRQVTIDDLNKMEFTMAIIKETLRKSTPVVGIFPRLALKDHKLQDISVRKGDLVDIEYFYNHYNKDYFGNPDKFDPYRWINPQQIIDSYAYTPFSAGPRNCLGQHLATIESRIIIAEFLSMYEFKMREGYEFKASHNFLYGPTEPIILKLTLKETV